MIITIKHREVKPTKDGKNKYLELIKEDDKKKVVFSDLYDKWELCQEGATVELKLDPTKNFKVVDIIPVGEQLPPAKEPAPLSQEQEAEIDKALKPPPNPQAVGMCTKEIGDMIRSKYLKPLFGDIHIGLIKWYQGQILDITRIPFDEAELPQFKPKRLPNEAEEPDDVPF